MRSVLAVCCAASSRFWVYSPPAVQPAQRAVAWSPGADAPVVVSDGYGFLAVDPRRAAVGYGLPGYRAPVVYMQEAPPPPPQKFGATVDQDGKSNVWAVEPAMKVDSKTDKKGWLKFAPVVLVAALAFLSVPLLPVLFASNPDQV